jgi:hypothetical protein
MWGMSPRCPRAPTIDFSKEKGIRMHTSCLGFMVPDKILPPPSSTGPKCSEPENFVEVPCLVDELGNCWLLLPSGRVTRQSSTIQPVSVDVLSGSMSRRLVAPGFSATSLRQFRLEDIAILEGESLLSMIEA